MNRFFPQFFFILIISFYVLKFYIELQTLSKRVSHNKNPDKLDELLKLRKFDASIYTESMARNKEWEQFDKVTFFKRSAAYYFKDRKLIRLFFVTLAFHIEHLEISLVLVDESAPKHSQQLLLRHTQVKRHDQWGSYRSSSLNFDMDSTYNQFRINVDKYLSSRRSLRLMAFVKDANSTRSTMYPIELKIKNLRNVKGKPKKSNSAICSKCYYYLEDSKSYKHFEWWFEMSKQMGYHKIVVCNNSIPNTVRLNRVFDKYKHMLEIYHVKQLPNLLVDFRLLNNTGNPYLKSFYDLKRHRKFYKPMARVFDNVIFNECYLDNVDKYKYVAVLDNDEHIVPRVTPKINKHTKHFDYVSRLDLSAVGDLDSVESKLNLRNQCWTHYEPSERNIHTYITNFKDTSSLYYKMGLYLKDSIVKQIVASIEAFLATHAYDATRSREDSYIRVIDLTPDSKYHIANNYTFVVESRKDFAYARNLCKLYRLLIEPVENATQSAATAFSNRFNRFFYVAGKNTYRRFGKTIHYTDRTLQLIHHYPIATRYDVVLYENGHCSHFRDMYTFDYKIPISIKELLIDWNYYYCFYKPTFDALSASPANPLNNS